MQSYGVELHKKGNRWWAACPFHQEKTASFLATDERFKCFGCGQSGDVIDFVMKMDGIDFKEAIKKLNCGDIQISEELKKQKEERKRILKAERKRKKDIEIQMVKMRKQLEYCYRVVDGIKTESDLMRVGSVYHRIGNLEYKIDTLADSLYLEAKNETIQVKKSGA